jgi:uncharacterized protein YndB with AHSA1/START domain
VVSQTVSASVRISARPDEVFPYLVDAELTGEWLGSWADLNPVPGGRFDVDIRGQATRGEFLAIEPHHRVVFTWGTPGSERMPPGSSQVEILLTVDDDETVVNLSHTGLPAESGVLPQRLDRAPRPPPRPPRARCSSMPRGDDTA